MSQELRDLPQPSVHNFYQVFESNFFQLLFQEIIDLELMVVRTCLKAELIAVQLQAINHGTNLADLSRLMCFFKGGSLFDPEKISRKAGQNKKDKIPSLFYWKNQRKNK